RDHHERRDLLQAQGRGLVGGVGGGQGTGDRIRLRQHPPAQREPVVHRLRTLRPHRDRVFALRVHPNYEPGAGELPQRTLQPTVGLLVLAALGAARRGVLLDQRSKRPEHCFDPEVRLRPLGLDHHLDVVRPGWPSGVRRPHEQCRLLVRVVVHHDLRVKPPQLSGSDRRSLGVSESLIHHLVEHAQREPLQCLGSQPIQGLRTAEQGRLAARPGPQKPHALIGDERGDDGGADAVETRSHVTQWPSDPEGVHPDRAHVVRMLPADAGPRLGQPRDPEHPLGGERRCCPTFVHQPAQQACHHVVRAHRLLIEILVGPAVEGDHRIPRAVVREVPAAADESVAALLVPLELQEPHLRVEQAAPRHPYRVHHRLEDRDELARRAETQAPGLGEQVDALRGSAHGSEDADLVVDFHRASEREGDRQGGFEGHREARAHRM
ncbi:unnamed protein product, partial [Penicillium discolor]